jgi:LPPG:FO 2-phospho-L-lactate transferase
MSGRPTYTVLSGGVGGAKLVLGLQHVLEPSQLKVIANTGDDFDHLGLRICPDIDTLLYTLAGTADPERGWGLAGESWQLMAQLEKLGGPTWFRLGDRDLATHLLRTEWLSAGKSLSDVCCELRRSMDVLPEIWPMSDQPVRTRIVTDAGTLDFQDYFVRQQARPAMRAVAYAGCDTAAAAPAALEALSDSALGAIIITPSNPWLSIDPILSLSDIKSKIKNTSMPVVGVSPIVGGKAIKGPTAKLMAEIGIKPSALSIAQHYADLLDGLVIDEQDAGLRGAIEETGITVEISNTIMRNTQDKIALAETVVALANRLAEARNA